VAATDDQPSWLNVTATAVFSAEAEHERLWRADAIPWREENTEAFAGLHTRHGTPADSGNALADHPLAPQSFGTIDDLPGLAVPINRHAVDAEALRRIARLEDGKVVAQHDPDRVAEPGGRARRALHQRIA
jgi:hypothetical protein